MIGIKLEKRLKENYKNTLAFFFARGYRYNQKQKGKIKKREKEIYTNFTIRILPSPVAIFSV